MFRHVVVVCFFYPARSFFRVLYFRHVLFGRFADFAFEVVPSAQVGATATRLLAGGAHKVVLVLLRGQASALLGRRRDDPDLR